MKQCTGTGIYQISHFDKEMSRIFLSNPDIQSFFNDQRTALNIETHGTSSFSDKDLFLAQCDTVFFSDRTPVHELEALLNKCKKIILIGIPLLLTEYQQEIISHILESNVDFEIIQASDYLKINNLLEKKHHIQHISIQRTFCYGMLQGNKLLQQITNDLFFILSLSGDRILKIKTQPQYTSEHVLLVLNILIEMGNGSTCILQYDQIDTDNQFLISIFTSEETYKIKNHQEVKVLIQKNHLIEIASHPMQKESRKIIEETISMTLHEDSSMSRSLRFLQETIKNLMLIKKQLVV
jgi:hypothetical protein